MLVCTSVYSRCRLFCWTCFSWSLRLCLSGISLPSHCCESCRQSGRVTSIKVYWKLDHTCTWWTAGHLSVWSTCVFPLMRYICSAYLQLLLQQGDFSNACFSGLVGLLHLSALSWQTKPNILQFALQLGLLIILVSGKERVLRFCWCAVYNVQCVPESISCQLSVLLIGIIWCFCFKPLCFNSK